jgi:hypothetical protein
MNETRRDPDLTMEALDALGAVALEPEHLERHRPAVLQVAREKDDRHSARTDGVLDLVAVRQPCAERGDVILERFHAIGSLPPRRGYVTTASGPCRAHR